MKQFRVLDKDFMNELLRGKLKHVLQFERDYRKSLIVEIRDNFLDLYFLGHSIEVKRSAKLGYYISASSTFDIVNGTRGEFKDMVKHADSKRWQIFFNDIKDYKQFCRLMEAIISKIVLHKYGDISEGVSELNHFVDNRAIGKNGILVIDKQVVYPGIRGNRIDLLGVTRIPGKKGLFTFVVIELKNKNNPQIGEVFTQTKRYIDLIYDEKNIYEDFRATYMTVIRQKIALGLLKNVKCDIAPWDAISKQDILGVVILDNFNMRRDIQENGLMQRALHDWKQIPKAYNIMCFLKTNVLDSTFFLDRTKAEKTLTEYKRCNL